MRDAELGGIIRALRHRRGLRQVDLARKSGVSDSLVAMVEGGAAESVSLRSLRRLSAGLGIRLGWEVGYRGAELARLLDADHAALTGLLARRLRAADWVTQPEVSFSRYGDRGRVDLLAWHPARGQLAVVEVKTVITDIQGTLGALDVKRRHAPFIARSLGWPTEGSLQTALPVLIVAATTTNRRRVVEHAPLFAALDLRGRAAQTWLRRPAGRPHGILLFVEVPYSRDAGLRKAGRQRVRQPPRS